MKLVTTIILITITSLLSTDWDAQFEEIRENHSLVGISVTIGDREGEIYSFHSGKRDLSRDLDINSNSVYRIASVSKLVTALALFTLVDSEGIDIDSDASNYLHFELRNPSYQDQTITIRSLLSHQSSLRDGDGYSQFLSNSYQNENPPSIDQLLLTDGSFFTSNLYSNQYSPEDNYFQYANINYGVIGTIIENISGMRFDQYLVEKVLNPIGVKGSYNVEDIIDPNDIAVLYRFQGGSWTPQADHYNGVVSHWNLAQYEIGSNGLLFAPQGGLRISSEDMERIIRVLLNSGSSNGYTLLHPSTLEEFITTQWIYDGSNGNNYYGIFNKYAHGNHLTTDLLDGFSLVGHCGEAYGLISDSYCDVEKGYSITFITNGGSWGYGSYSGWYNIEEEIFQLSKQFLDEYSTDIDELTIGFDLSIYPNPFNNSTTIKVDGDEKISSVKIYDIEGKEVLSIGDIDDSSYTLNFNYLSTGIYFIRVEGLSKLYSSQPIVYLK
jgi:CubicO group peptidase (beta-lactamase class C family)